VSRSGAGPPRSRGARGAAAGGRATELAEDRAASALADLGDISLTLFPSLPLTPRAWDLRRNLTAADALFVALAELLGEPLATKDAALAAAARRHTRVQVIMLGG
jgi:predicted nucleic acid-binding protein